MTNRSESGSPESPTSEFERRTIERLKEAGCRITMPRIQVARVLAQSSQALSPYQIHERIVQSGGSIDVVSVYRILATFVSLNVVHHIGMVNGYRACDLGDGHKERMEHAICRSCGAIIELPVPDATISATQEQLVTIGFKPNVVKIEIEGSCSRCAS